MKDVFGMTDQSWNNMLIANTKLHMAHDRTQRMNALWHTVCARPCKVGPILSAGPAGEACLDVADVRLLDVCDERSVRLRGFTLLTQRRQRSPMATASDQNRDICVQSARPDPGIRLVDVRAALAQMDGDRVPP